MLKKTRRKNTRCCASSARFLLGASILEKREGGRWFDYINSYSVSYLNFQVSLRCGPARDMVEGKLFTWPDNNDARRAYSKSSSSFFAFIYIYIWVVKFSRASNPLSLSKKKAAVWNPPLSFRCLTMSTWCIYARIPHSSVVTCNCICFRKKHFGYYLKCEGWWRNR